MSTPSDPGIEPGIEPGSDTANPWPVRARRVIRWFTVYVAYAVAAMAICAPLALEGAVESARFEDRLGTLPVEVSLAHDGRSTLDSGILGKAYWTKTGTAGFGAVVRATGTPEAGGTLSSYVDNRFVRANVEAVGAPEELAAAYGKELGRRLWDRFRNLELLAALLGGTGLFVMFRGRAPLSRLSRRRRAIATLSVLAGATLTTTLVAYLLFDRWDGSASTEESFPMPGVPGLSFSSREVLELAQQVEPFIEKNSERVEERADAYVERVEETGRGAIAAALAELSPRVGEVIVLAEADPQGSIVGTRARTGLYAVLREELGEDAVAVRTISGDITSNGTVAERSFVRAEAEASPEVPTVVVKGDHDTDTTLGQIGDTGLINPEFEPTEVNGLRLVAGNDPAFKTLFGGVVVNETGVSERQLGQDLRAKLAEDEDDGPLIVLFHQPRSAAGFIGVTKVGDLEPGLGRETIPWDDGIPDLPPGIINIGHLHDAESPLVIWNTDSDEVTWTVVNQLGTSGGVEERPTFNRFSTPFSTPLKQVSIQVQFVDSATGLQTGYAAISIDTDGTVRIEDRVDLGVPLQQ